MNISTLNVVIVCATLIVAALIIKEHKSEYRYSMFRISDSISVLIDKQTGKCLSLNGNPVFRDKDAE